MITSELKSKCCKADVILGGEGQTHYYICTSCNHAADIWVDTWEDRMNWIINGHLTIGKDGRADCEWLDEDDQINMRKDLKVFIGNLLKAEREKGRAEVIEEIPDDLDEHVIEGTDIISKQFPNPLKKQLKEKFNLN